MLEIAYRSHINKICSVLNVMNIEYVYFCQICILILLLQRHKYTKETLLTIEEDNVLDLVLSEHIEKTASTLEIERNKITYYPD